MCASVRKVNSVSTITLILDLRATLTYSARRYDSAVCSSKMSCDAFLSGALYEADKAIEKFA